MYPIIPLDSVDLSDRFDEARTLGAPWGVSIGAQAGRADGNGDQW
jgi:hypothetical protein